MEPISSTMRASLFLGMFLVCLLLEGLFPLRMTTQPKSKRLIMNLAFAAIGLIVLRLTFLRLVFFVSNISTQNQWGLLYLINLPYPLEILLGLFLMDYTFYFWHVANHKISFLWRFHNVHHVDLDMDVSTASRFHAGELILSTPFRSLQIVVFGIDPFTWIVFETLVVVSTQFHHSNIRFPERWERFLCKIIVTPRMHGIHHSIIQQETDSNFSTIFSFWDKIQRSFKWGIPESDIMIGVAAYRDPKELTLIKLLILPFRRPRAWKLPDGRIPTRPSH